MSVLHNLEVARLRGVIDALRRRAGEDSAWTVISDAVSQEINRSKYLEHVASQTQRRVVGDLQTGKKFSAPSGG
jgi:hypothetical protein